jgi:hypothetical protein
MAGLNNTKKSFILLLFAALLFVMPSAAINTAIYGDTAGFNPDLHKDTFTILYSLPGSLGSDLDTNITKYTDPAIDVIFMGGEDTFSPATASQLEKAVSSGKIFVVSKNNYQKFDSSLPASSKGSTQDGLYFFVNDPNTTISKTIFSGLPLNFPNTDPLSRRANTEAKKDAITLMSYDKGDPALLYWKYGNGYVIEWTPGSNSRFLNNTEADLVNQRLITLLINEMPKPAVTTISPTQSNLGSVSVYSSPLGASILIDGRYYGTTPANLTEIQPGNHIIRLTLSGYYDYEGTIYVLAGQTTHAYGTLPPLNQFSGAPTPVPTTPAPIIVQVPVTVEPTQKQGTFDNPGVIAAIIGVITATIGAIATIFSHISKAKKE